MKDHEITQQIIGASFDVINELGAGFLESVYERSLLIALHDKGITAASQVPVPVYFRNTIVGDFYADLIVAERIIVELKVVRKVAPEHFAQVINYLKATGYETALLINFGTPRLEYRRLKNNFINRDVQDEQDS